MTTRNELRSSWPIQGGYIEVNIVTSEPLPADAWPEIAVLMSVCQTFADRVSGSASTELIPIDGDPTVTRDTEEDDTRLIPTIRT